MEAAEESDQFVAAGGVAGQLDRPFDGLGAGISERYAPCGVSGREVATFAELYPALRPGELLDGTSDPRFGDAWSMARADSFAVPM